MSLDKGSGGGGGEGTVWILDSSGDSAISTTEVTLVEKTTIIGLKGNIFSTNMAVGDRFIIRVYSKDASGGTYRLEAEEYFEGAQTIDCKSIGEIMGEWGLKVTIQKDAGTDRNFKWVFWRDR